MASETDICNRALQKLGAARITSLTDQSVNARACSACYFVLRDALYRAHPWSFAIQRFSLAANATAPVFGPYQAFPLPTGWARVLPPDAYLNSQDRDWKIEGGQILTNNFDSYSGSGSSTAPLKVRIVMKITDTTLMDVSYQEALSAKMAYEMCEQLTQSNAKKAAALQDYKLAIEEAKKNNAIEQVPQDAAEDYWITARA